MHVPLVSRICLRLALAWFVLGFAAGAVLLSATALGVALPRVWVVQHAHVLFVGFVTNMIFGVAYWMFPRPHGRIPRVGAQALSVGALNVGLLLRVVAEPWHTFGPQPATTLALLASAGLQLAAALLFVWALSSRIMTTRGSSPVASRAPMRKEAAHEQ